ncbi:MAG: hypothetical protein JW732_01845 [Dehalococcoidia bacterium]|nr:hypothetical protein [Dehalococcoidia bacterium]
MDKRQAYLGFHHSERLKSNLFLVSGALDRLTTLRGERLEGGEEVTKAVFDVLRNEFNMARQHFAPAAIDSIESQLSEVKAGIELHDYAKAREHLGKTFSHVTTLGDRYIRVLIDENLV